MHAIERVRFVVQFKQQISEKLAERVKQEASQHSVDTRMVGPSPIQAVQIGFQVSPDGKQQFLPAQSEIHGWQYVRSSSANLPLEVLAVQGNQIIYETTEYRNWSNYKKRFEKVSAGAVRVASDALDIDLVALEYFDRFVFEGPRDQADPKSLLLDIEKHLGPDAGSGRTMWHMHRGWFEKDTNGDVLINQNFDAIDAVLDQTGNPSRTISLLSKAELRSANYPLAGMLLEDLLNLLHDFTGRYFKAALVPTMLEAVGLTKEGKS